jgi:hypothetical protein
MELFLVNRGPLTFSTAMHVRLKRVQPRYRTKTWKCSSLTRRPAPDLEFTLQIASSENAFNSVAAGWVSRASSVCAADFGFRSPRADNFLHLCKKHAQILFASFYIPTALCLAFLCGDYTCLFFTSAANKQIKNGTGSKTPPTMRNDAKCKYMTWIPTPTNLGLL